jgi:Tat protein secretion system quality control protein TatD with DNase activity
MDEADNLALAASGGSVAAIGECGFDFYGDVPERLRSPANERAQAEVFEFQLSLAERFGLPIVLHLRRANDMLFRYAARLSRLKAVALHAWGGPANEALDFLSRCPRALFSFGTGALNGNKKARASIAALPASALLAETDAPYQPPRSEAPPCAASILAAGRMPDAARSESPRRPPMRAYSTPSDIALVIGCIAGLRGEHPTLTESYIEKNFTEAFGHAL